MRDVNRLERAIALLALYVWRWLEAMQDFANTVRENERGLRRGAADEDWQHTLRVMAAPIRKRRLIEESGEHLLAVTVAEWRPGGEYLSVVEQHAPAWGVEAGLLPAPSLAVPVITETGAVVEVIPTPAEHIRNHRVFDMPPAHPVQPRPRRVSQTAKRRAMSTEAAVRAAERRVRKQLDKVVMEAMQALGLSLEEAREVMNAHHYENVFDRMAVGA